jgi:hypothetical protein
MGMLNRVMIISIILLLLLHFNIERVSLPPVEKDGTTPSDDSDYGRTGTRADNGTGEGNFTPLRSHIRTFINGGTLIDHEHIAQNHDVYAWGNLNAKSLNPGSINLLYDYFGTMVPKNTNRKYQALLEYCDLYGLTSEELEDMFLHVIEDGNYTLGNGTDALDPPETRLVPGWDPVNDVDGDGFVNDTEFASRANPNASARYRNESRIPIYYWGPPADYHMNIGNDNYQDFIVSYYAPKILLGNEGIDDPLHWITTNPISVVNEGYEGNHSSLIEVEGDNKNLINRQYVELKPDTIYTIGVMIKTENLTGGINVYKYEFEDSETIVGNIHVSTSTSDWTFHYSQFRINSDVDGRITFRFYGGPGKVWVDELFLVEGQCDNYADIVSQPNILKNGGFEEMQYARYDGLWLDTLHTYPTVQNDTEVLEYPDVSNYSVDIKTLLSDLKSSLPDGTIIIGNGWVSDPIIISGSEYESWAKITKSISPKKLDTIIDRDEKGIMQLIQYHPIYHEVANPNRPDLFVEGISLERDQMYSLALYYLVHGEHTYYGYGAHGGYHLDEERWFDAVNYDIGQPLGSYYFFDMFNETENILINGNFETDDDSDGNPDHWQTAEPVELDYDIKCEGNSSAKIESQTEINNINKQYVTLEPDTTYTLSGWIKTENVTGRCANIYPYEFNDLQEEDHWIEIKGTTDWTFYSMTFTTCSDVEGRINYRLYGTGTAWFDDLHLTKGRYCTVFARDFENATVVLNPKHITGDNTTVAYDLDGIYRPLKADGTLEAPVNTIELMTGEGAILVKEVIPENCIILKQGWNLVSVPLIQGEQDMRRVLESIEGLYDIVQWYDASDPMDPWKNHVMGKPFGNDLFELNESMGFWIHITQPGITIFIYNGTIPATSQQITLYKGWNLIGYPSLTGYSRTEGLNNLAFDSEVDAIWAYSAEAKTWRGLGEGDSFEIGKGYWVHATDNMVWDVPQ